MFPFHILNKLCWTSRICYHVNKFVWKVFFFFKLFSLSLFGQLLLSIIVGQHNNKSLLFFWIFTYSINDWIEWSYRSITVCICFFRCFFLTSNCSRIKLSSRSINGVWIYTYSMEEGKMAINWKVAELRWHFYIFRFNINEQTQWFDCLLVIHYFTIIFLMPWNLIQMELLPSIQHTVPRIWSDSSRTDVT